MIVGYSPLKRNAKLVPPCISPFFQTSPSCEHCISTCDKFVHGSNDGGSLGGIIFRHLDEPEEKGVSIDQKSGGKQMGQVQYGKWQTFPRSSERHCSQLRVLANHSSPINNRVSVERILHMEWTIFPHLMG